MPDIYLTSPLKKKGTIHLPMIDFEILRESIGFGDCDMLMFTSKQAVATADEIDRRWTEYPAIAIGGATAEEIERRGGKVLHKPSNFYGKELADDVAKLYRNRKVLYLRPEEVSFDSKSYLAEKGIELYEEIIYRTSCLHYDVAERPPENSIVIFTSPSTIRCFLKNFGWDQSYTAVVIGSATLDHLPPDTRYVIAEIPRIDACVEAAKKLYPDNFA